MYQNICHFFLLSLIHLKKQIQNYCFLFELLLTIASRKEEFSSVRWQAAQRSVSEKRFRIHYIQAPDRNSRSKLAKRFWQTGPGNELADQV